MKLSEDELNKIFVNFKTDFTNFKTDFIIGFSIIVILMIMSIIILINEKPITIEKEIIYKGIVINTYKRYINYHIQNGDTLSIDTTYVKIK